MPAETGSTKIAYTVVGEPNMAAVSGPITGPSAVCITNSTFTLHNRPPGATVSWMRSKNLIYVSGQGTDNYTVRAYSNEDKSSAFVKATVTGTCGQTILQKTTWVGRPGLPVTSPDGDPPMEVPYGSSFLVNIFHPPGAVPATGAWSTLGSISITTGGSGSSCGFEAVGIDYGQWHVTTSNSCGVSDTYIGQVIVPGWKFSMQPNPANDYVEIIAEKKEYDTKGIVSDTYEVKIFNILKNTVYISTKTDQPLLRIDTKQFVNGTYFIHFTAGKQSVVKQLVINH